MVFTILGGCFSYTNGMYGSYYAPDGERFASFCTKNDMLMRQKEHQGPPPPEASVSETRLETCWS